MKNNIKMDKKISIKEKDFFDILQQYETQIKILHKIIEKQKRILFKVLKK